jgi:hypothetical protein
VKGHVRPPRCAAEILQYYLAHPGSADTLEGLAGWRLLEDFVRRRVTDTDQAVQWLVEQGYLQKIGGTAATPDLYCLNRGKQREAERLIGRLRSTSRSHAKARE